MRKYYVTVTVSDLRDGKRGTANTTDIEIEARSPTEAATMLARAISMLSGSL